MDIIISLRFHATVLAAIQGIPVSAKIYHHKVAEFVDVIAMRKYAEELGDGSTWVESKVDSARLLKSVLSIQSNYNSIILEM